MEVKNTLMFEVKKNENMYRMEMPMNAPVGEAYSAVADFMERIVAIINEQAEKRRVSDLENEEKVAVAEEE